MVHGHKVHIAFCRAFCGQYICDKQHQLLRLKPDTEENASKFEVDMKVCPPVAMVHVAILGSLLLGLAKSDGVVVQEVNSYGEPSAVVIASDGLPIVAGNSNAASQAGDFAGSASYGSADVVVTKYTLAGAQSATYKVGTTSQDAAEAMEIDSSDNIFVSGWSFGGFDDFTSAGKEDVFILKLDSSLSKVWLIQFGTTGSDYAVAIGLDSSGNVIVGGKTEGTWPDKDLVGGYDAWISLFNSTGDQQWILQFGSTAYDDLMDLAVDTVDSVDMIYATGYTQGNFEGGTHAGGQDDDPFLIKASRGQGGRFLIHSSSRTIFFAQQFVTLNMLQPGSRFFWWGEWDSQPQRSAAPAALDQRFGQFKLAEQDETEDMAWWWTQPTMLTSQGRPMVL